MANLATSAVLLPLAPISTWLGAKLVRVVSFDTFYRISYAALFIIALQLLWHGAANLF